MEKDKSKVRSSVSPQEPNTHQPRRIIQPQTGWVCLNLPELVEYRELIWLLAWRDVSSRYKQTAVGIAWAVIQPFVLMVVFTVFFGNMAKIPSEGVPYPIFNYAGMLPWQYFFSAMVNSSNSLLANSPLLTKVYFPRLVIPCAATLPPLIDFGISSIILVGMMIYFGIAPGLGLLWIPALVLLAFTTALGAGLWLGALGMLYRDVHHLVPFIAQVLMFASPVVYPSTLVPEKWRALYGLNPAAGIIEGFRWSLLSIHSPQSTAIICSSVAVSLILLLSGIIYFRQVEKDFADLV